MFILCTNGPRPTPIPITATGDLGGPQQEEARGAAEAAGRVEGVALRVRAVQMSIQELGGRGTAYHCLAPVSSKARLTKADEVVDGFTTSPSFARRRMALSLVTNRELPITALLIVPLAPRVLVVVDVDLHTELSAVVVVGLVGRPRLVTDPRAVVPHPGPGVAYVASGDSNPVVGTPRPVGQQGDQVVVLPLALDGHHVCVVGLAPLPGFGPVHVLCGGVVRPAMGTAHQVTREEDQCALHGALQRAGPSHAWLMNLLF